MTRKIRLTVCEKTRAGEPIAAVFRRDRFRYRENGGKVKLTKSVIILFRYRHLGSFPDVSVNADKKLNSYQYKSSIL